jgi:hypothetical protein
MRSLSSPAAATVIVNDGDEDDIRIGEQAS